MGKLFGIDYDGTFAVDPLLFRALILLIIRGGHSVIMVTGRSDDGCWGEEVREATVGLALPVVFAGGAWKREAALRAGWAVDIWIEDHPEWVGRQIGALRPPPAGELRATVTGHLAEVGNFDHTIGACAKVNVQGMSVSIGQDRHEAAFNMADLQIPLTDELARHFGARLYDKVTVTIVVEPRNVTEPFVPGVRIALASNGERSSEEPHG